MEDGARNDEMLVSDGSTPSGMVHGLNWDGCVDVSTAWDVTAGARRFRCVCPPASTRQAPPEVTERMDKLPPRALLRAACAMGQGMKYEDDGYAHWKTQEAEYHLNRALIHIRLWQAGDTSQEHVDHAISRLLMWGDMVDGSQNGGN